MGKTEKDVVIVGAARTAIGKFLGGVAGVPAPELLATVIKGVVDDLGVEKELIEEVLAGNVVSAGIGQSPARQAALKAQLPVTVAATTINKVCGSGLKAVMLGASLIKAGDRRVVFAGGMESMSRVPHYLPGLRQGVKYGEQVLLDGLIFDGLQDPYHNQHMGCFAEYTAEKAQISRLDQDSYSVESHKRALAARDFHASDIVAVTVDNRKSGNGVEFVTDELPRSDTSLEVLGKLKSAFSKDGSVTAGNASPLSDGAAGVLLMQRGLASSLGLEIKASIKAYATSGLEPRDIFFAPADAIRINMQQIGLKNVNQFDAIEINEAFAAQTLANQRSLGIDIERLNRFGGALALGHPIGASGARVLVTLLNVLRRIGGTLGCVAVCLGGGNAVSMVIERE
jgi:acetyl-CoA C-acetyltransferase